MSINNERALTALAEAERQYQAAVVREGQELDRRIAAEAEETK